MNAKEHKAWETEIVSCSLRYEVNNCMTHNFYWVVKVRIWTGNNTFFRRKFIVWYDSFELQDWYEDKKYISQANKREYALELAWSFLSRVPTKGKVTCNALKQFTDDCNETIHNYNRIATAA